MGDFFLIGHAELMGSDPCVRIHVQSVRVVFSVKNDDPLVTSRVPHVERAAAQFSQSSDVLTVVDLMVAHSQRA